MLLSLLASQFANCSRHRRDQDWAGDGDGGASLILDGRNTRRRQSQTKHEAFIRHGLTSTKPHNNKTKTYYQAGKRKL